MEKYSIELCSFNDYSLCNMNILLFEQIVRIRREQSYKMRSQSHSLYCIPNWYHTFWRFGESSISVILSLCGTAPDGVAPLAPVTAMALTGREPGGDVAGGAGGCETGRRELVGGDVELAAARSSGSLSCTALNLANELPLSGRSSSCDSLDDVGTYVLSVVGARSRWAGAACDSSLESSFVDTEMSGAPGLDTTEPASSGI